MKKFILAIFTMFIALSTVVGAAENSKVSSEEFLRRVRNYRGTESYAVSNGTIHHRRAGKSAEKGRITLANLLTPLSVKAKLLLDNSEAYKIEQKYSGESTVVESLTTTTPDGGLLNKYGLRAEDLTMSFIYWPFEKELPGESVRTIYCRKFDLKSPDGKELARVSISEKYLFPVRVEFFTVKDDGSLENTRSMEVSTFRKQDDFYIVSRMIIWLDKKWRTEIIFDNVTAEYLKKPEDLPMILKDIQ